MKLVVTADVHLHPYRICSKDGGHDRLLDGLSALRQTLELAQKQRAAWVMAGDFKQPKTMWPQEALTGALEVLRGFPDVDKIMLAGNHDARGLGGTGLAPFATIRRTRVIESEMIVQLDDETKLVCAPWDADMELTREACEIAGVSALVAHAFLAGTFLGPDETRLPGKGHTVAEYGNFPVAFFGDIHKGQWYRRGDLTKGLPPRWETYEHPSVEPLEADAIRVRPAAPWAGEVLYPGSPYQQTWGERNDGPKGALLADLLTGEVWLHFVKAPRFRKLECDEAALEKAEDNGTLDRWAGDFVHVVYNGKPGAALDVLGNWAPKFRSFQVTTRRAERAERRPVEVHAGMSRREMLQGYLAARPPAEGVDRARVLEAGLRLMEETAC